ncbi:hypothetical protein F4781DRAFT_421575 [Annulohypoxylon bovei var. microspora]|nr:hypothetical protein F4781DRAFT_421575 [Annulohypoxylon bovei var. microspora]
MSAQTWQRGNNPQRVSQPTAMRSVSGPVASNQQRQRNDESWVEVCSHPSSSSVSSIGDEIVTTGLQVGSSYHGRRRRRLHPQPHAHSDAPQPTFVAGQVGQTGTSSSQEEYEESESEDDRVLTSSAENIASPQAARSTPLRQVQPVESDSSDDDDRATALGTRPPEQPFQPQPNAFSHPPSHLTHRHSTSSTLPQHHHRPSFGQRSQTRVDRRAPNFISSNYQADNDAALRASLTTLLSCAAAAGKRSKDGEKEMGERSNAATGNQPLDIRFATENDLMGPPPSTQTRGAGQPPRASPQVATSREPAGEKVKRSATPTPNSKSSRATKKKRTSVTTGEETFISPTLLTWVVSAGVVVLVSVVGFGAGYVIGREVGRQETLNGLGAVGNASAVAEGGNCGREVIRSGGGTLRRFRWGTAMGRSVAA